MEGAVQPIVSLPWSKCGDRAVECIAANRRISLKLHNVVVAYAFGVVDRRSGPTCSKPAQRVLEFIQSS